MKQIIAATTVFATLLTHTFAQERPEIVTDRPDQTEAPSLVPRGGLQVETGFVYEKDKDRNVTVTNFTYNSTLLKYGINENFELRFISEYLGTRTKVDETRTSKTNGFSPIAVGVKIRLADEKGLWPQASLIGHLTLKSGSKEFQPDYTAGDFRFTFAHTLSKRFALSYNVGAEWDGETPQAFFLYTLSLGYLITDNFGLFIETYSFFPEHQKADNRFDAGVTYKFSPVIQWDLSAGIGLSSNAPDSFVGTGLSVRMFK
jgi:hypothetical protein